MLVLPTRSSLSFALAAGLLLCCAGDPTRAQKASAGRPKAPVKKKRNVKMSTPLSRYRDEVRVALPPETPITPAPKPVIAPRATAEPGNVVMQFVNAARNSRSGVNAPSDPLTIRWRAALSAFNQPPLVLLAAADRIVAYGELSWQLFQADGASPAHAAIGMGAVTLDPDWNLFYFPDKFGRVAANQLSDGAPAFSLLPRQTKGFARRLLTRFENSLLAVSYEVAIDAHAADPEYSIAESFDLIGPENRKSWLDAGGPAVVQDAVSKSAVMLPAMRKDSLVLALDNVIYTLDPRLEVRSVLTGEFQPLAFSLDEARRIYLLLGDRGKMYLWRISPAGERLYSLALPPGFDVVASPPIVGYDHTVYLVSGRFILSVAEDGKLNWSREASTGIAGAVVTPDNRLIVSEGANVVSWNAKGERTLLHAFPEPLVTAPVLTKEGDLLVASRTTLYCASR